MVINWSIRLKSQQNVFILSLPRILRELGTRLDATPGQSLSQRELAHMAGLSLGALRKLETDGPMLAGSLFGRVAGAGPEAPSWTSCLC